MANYAAVARSNYFSVKDIDAFRLEMAKVSDIHVECLGEGESQTVALFCQTDDGWPSEYYPDEVLADPVSIDLPAMVASHLAEGSVAVFLESGNEGLRFVGGHATAVDAAGERVDLNLHDIFKLASGRLRGEALNRWA